MEQRPHLLTAICGFGERDLLLLGSAGRLSLVRSQSYDILPAKDLSAPPLIYIVDDSPTGQAIWSEMLHRFGDPHVRVLGIGDSDHPTQLQAFRYAHYRRPILATRLLKALDGLLGMPQESRAAAPQPAAPHTPQPAAGVSLDRLKGRHILLVTGNQAIRHVLESRLAALGISTSCAQDEATAVSLATSVKYDLALMEPGRIQCPDCFALVRQLKQVAGESFPVILLIDEATPRERMRGVLNGVSGYLAKPVSVRQLHQTLLDHCVEDCPPGP